MKEEPKMKPFQFRIGAFFLMLMILCALMPFAVAQSANSATVSLLDKALYYSLPFSKIDISAPENASGVSFGYKIQIILSQEQFDQYIAPLAENNKWQKNQAKNFTVTFPADLFDKDLLTVDWAGSNASSLFLTEMKSKDDTGVVIQGKQGSDRVTLSSAQNNLYVNVPVKLEREKYQAALEKGGIKLKGTVTVSNGVAGTPPLYFEVDHTFPVIDSANMPHSLTVKDSSGNEPVFSGNQWNLTSGTYTVSGKAEPHEGLKITGDVTLNLQDATIEHNPDSAYLMDLATQKLFIPAISIESGNVTLNLEGESTVKGSPGHAGIYVSTGATLTISGTGKLTATGGDYHPYKSKNDKGRTINLKYAAAGAGIGGNGFCQLEKDTDPDNIQHQPCFGEIKIEGGTVIATGGKTTDPTNYGGGAGIGTGGVSTEHIDPEKDLDLQGTVRISGGNVTATGGTASPATISGGGAGIGTGGAIGNNMVPTPSAFHIIIEGGTVNAHGSADSAGIGGGANVDSSSIEITGGNIIAIGGDEGNGDITGGAGIGSGDNCSASKIVISGTADVTAQGGGAAAGIGSGRGGNVGQINILEQAHVKATGGKGGAGIGGGLDGEVRGGITIEGKGTIVSAYGGLYDYSDDLTLVGLGSAGIGAGISPGRYKNGCGAISITNGATVRAYTDGKGANAIGTGGQYSNTNGANSLHLDDTISLWAQTPDQSRAALLEAGCGPTTYTSSSVYLTSNNNTTGKADGWLNQPSTSTSADKTFDYALTTTDLKIDGTPVTMAEPDPPVGNWATLYGLPSATVTYQYVGKAPDGAEELAPDTVAIGGLLTPKQPASVAGWRFDGWYTDAQCTAEFASDAGITGTTVLYGRWYPEATPIDPKAAVYKVEHVQKQTDGSYKLVDVDFPLYGELGQTVTAAERSYEGYEVNSAASTLSGVIVPPVDGTYLVLTVRYDPLPKPTPKPTEKPQPTVKPTVKPSATPQPASLPPRTGDSATPLLWLALLAASALGMGAMVASKSKLW